MDPLARLDHAHVWHPFTQMQDWLSREPIVIVAGQGAVLRDTRGRTYLDANASIWTNLHGHQHPRLDAAVARQLRKIAHSSALGLANEPASILAARLVRAARIREGRGERGDRRSEIGRRRLAEAVGPAADPALRVPQLEKVFFSDDGSTAVEVALKLAYEYARRTGLVRRPRFLSLAGGYHGDTVGAVSLGHIDLFHRAYAGLLFKSDCVMAPYCYRCPFNRARPERADARTYRRCSWECLGKVEQCLARQSRRGEPYAGFVVEPLIQGAAGMIPQPAGWLGRAAAFARDHGTLLVADEVMTGFGRTGAGRSDGEAGRMEDGGSRMSEEGRRTTDAQRPTDIEQRTMKGGRLFACHQAGVEPDFLCVAKGLTGGYLPMAATLTTQAVFDAFLGDYEEFKTFFHGHSYTGNQLGASVALASLDLLESSASQCARARLEHALGECLPRLWSSRYVGDVRQVGLTVGVELVRDWRTRESFDLRERAGLRVCEAMARRGVLTRPVGNVVVLMPCYVMTPAQVEQIVEVLAWAIRRVLG